MKNVRILGVCLLAAFALAAVAASSASASLPEWGGCEPTPTGHGKYKDPVCTVPATGAAKKTEGNYEWYTGNNFGWVNDREHGISEGAPNTALHITISSTTFQTTGGHEIACSGGNGRARLELAQSTNEVRDVYLAFEGCHEVGGEEKECSSPGIYGGEITDRFQYEEQQGFRGSLGFLAGKGGEHPTVGLSLTSFNKFVPETKEPEKLMITVCEGSVGTVWIGGENKGGNAVISEIGPIDTMTETHTQTYAPSSQGVQQWTSFEGKHASVLDEFVLHNWEQSAWSTSIEETDEYPIEIKAVR